jgi:hypothetical protein
MEQSEVEMRVHQVGQTRVMFEHDLATLYDVSVRELRKAVKQNNMRFPREYRFCVSPEEWRAFRKAHPMGYKMPRKCPIVFTDLGVAMVAPILLSDKAVRVSMDMISAFVAMVKTI